MKKPDFSRLRSRSFRAGGYGILVCCLALAIGVLVNLLATALPENLTHRDVTQQKLFTLSEQSEKLLDGLREQVTIYWVVQAGQEDDALEQLLHAYLAGGENLTLVQRDPDVYPDFLGGYGVTQGYNNSLVVESDKRYRYVSYSDIYSYDTSSYYTTGQYEMVFAGEQAITAAISYVTGEQVGIVYTTTGHGEATLGTTFSDGIRQSNMDLEELNPLTLQAVPENAGVVLIHAPERDFTQPELEVLEEYLGNGGSLLYISQPSRNEAPENLEALLADYGITANPGIVVEGNGNYYAMGLPYCLMPDIESHAITNPLADGNYYCMLPLSQGLTVAADLPEDVSAKALLTTSSRAFSKLAGYDMESFSREEGDVDGPFALAAVSVKTLEDGLESRLVWIGSSGITDEQTNLQVSGGNLDFFLNSLSWLCDQEDSVSIHAKSLGVSYLTMSDTTANILTIVLVILVPLLMLTIGLWISIRRKRR